MKKIGIVILFIIALLMVSASTTFAESDYYKLVWSYDWNAGTMSGIIDSIDTEDGFLAVGFTEGTNTKANILYFDKKGEYVSQTTYQKTKLAKIIKEGSYYYAFGKNEDNNTYVVLKLNSKGSIIDSLEFEAMNSLSNAEDDAFYVVSGESQFFIFDFWYFSEYEYNAIVIDKTFNLDECYDVPGEYWDDEMNEALEPYTSLHQFYMDYAFDWDGDTNEEVTDSIPYKGGFLVTRVEYNYQESILWYEKNGNPVWTVDLGNTFAKAVIPYEDIIIVSSGSWNDNSVNFEIFDKSGKHLETDDIYNYYPKDNSYRPEFFVELEDGFMTASTKDGNPLATQLMYFSKPFNVVTKTDGNGSIEVEPSAFSYNEVTFKVIPEEGYELVEVKVTDENGVVLAYTDDTFTMPSADVTIEASFKKIEPIETPEEPKPEEPKQEIVETPVQEKKQEAKNPVTGDRIIIFFAIFGFCAFILAKIVIPRKMSSIIK